MSASPSPAWPALDYEAWRETAMSLQLRTQVAGKIRLALTPWLNHSWHVPLYVTARGLGTGAMPVDGEVLSLEFDLMEHRLILLSSRGDSASVPLGGRSVAQFYDETMTALRGLGFDVAINETPSELPSPTRFSQDHGHGEYDPEAAHRFWRALIGAERVFALFRSGYLGKASPVHFFWGSFDLAVTRFSGRPAAPHPGGVPGLPDIVAREAYSHEVSSLGFWPGNPDFPHAAFYSYAYPEPPGYRDAPVSPPARFEPKLGEFILLYDDLRAASDPDATLLRFAQETYAAAADRGGWSRATLECPLGVPGRPRLPATENPA
jgi:hypothetical protein